MAQKIEAVLVDDLTGEPAAETVQFGVDGRHFELDLSKGNAKQLRAELKNYVRHARPVTAPTRAQEAARIRAWAKDHGYEVSARGRIHREVIEAYRQTV